MESSGALAGRRIRATGSGYRTTTMPKYVFWILSAVVALVAFSLVLAISPLGESTNESPAPVPPGAVGHPDPYPAPDFTLVDHREDERTLEDFRGRWLAVFFGFTHCPDVCPITLANLSSALEGLGGDADAFAVALVSVDPQRDTPERLDEYLEHFHPSIVGLTGEPEAIEEVASQYGIYAQRMEEDAEGAGHSPSGHAPGQEASPGAPDPHAMHDGDGTEPDDVPGSGDGYMVDHSSLVLMVDPDGRIVTSFPPFTPGEELEEGFRFLLEHHGPS